MLISCNIFQKFFEEKLMLISYNIFQDILRSTDASVRIGRKLSIISPPPFFCLLGEWVIVNSIIGWVKRIRG